MGFLVRKKQFTRRLLYNVDGIADLVVALVDQSGRYWVDAHGQVVQHVGEYKRSILVCVECQVVGLVGEAVEDNVHLKRFVVHVENGEGAAGGLIYVGIEPTVSADNLNVFIVFFFEGINMISVFFVH
jgi:hypothetical protein